MAEEPSESLVLELGRNRLRARGRTAVVVTGVVALALVIGPVVGAFLVH